MKRGAELYALSTTDERATSSLIRASQFDSKPVLPEPATK